MAPLPSKLLKTWSALTRWLLVVVLLAWGLFGLTWGALHWWIVPRISELRPTLEVQAARALGVPVRIGQIVVHSNGAVPSFELSDVQLLDAHGRVALKLSRVLVAVSTRSLWRLGFEQIYIDSPDVEVRRWGDGRLTVGGMELAASVNGSSSVRDWFFSQTEFIIQGGTLHWIDEMRGVEPLVLQAVNVVVRNTARQHNFQVDAIAPAQWGQGFSVRGRFLQPLLTQQRGQWQTWSGQLYADFALVDLSRLRRYTDLGIDVRQGRGALRAWVDIQHGQVAGATADVALNQVDLTLAENLPALVMTQVQGRLGAREIDNGIEAFAKQMSFDASDGLHWPGGDMHVRYEKARGNSLARTEVAADSLDLAALAQLAQRLPVSQVLRNSLLAYAPSGRAEKIALRWQGDAADPVRYWAKGRLHQLALVAVAPVPGLQGLDLDFEFDEKAGRADLNMADGNIELPAIFQDSRIDLTHLSGQMRWQHKGEDWSVQVSELAFSNDDTQGKANLNWANSDPRKAANHSRFPGSIALQVRLDRAKGNRVYRYLPDVIDPTARDYVRQAILDGQARNVRFDVQGEVSQLLTGNAHHGKFKISADVEGATMAYVPAALQPVGQAPWPVLAGLSGQLVFDQMQLQVKGARAHLLQRPAVQVMQADVTIADLRHTEVKVAAVLKASLQDALAIVQKSPIDPLLNGALAQASGSGAVDIKLDLRLPIGQLQQSAVKGKVILSTNDIQISPTTPKFARARGQVGFTERGLSLQGVQARILGGDAALEGALVLVDTAGASRSELDIIQVKGTATADGLRQATELGKLARLARFLGGSTAYSATFGVRGGQLEWQVQSNLLGLASALPAPLQKLAQSPLPLRIQSQLISPAPKVPGKVVRQRVSVALGQLGQAVYEQALVDQGWQVLRGAIEIGAGSSAPLSLPDKGISAQVQVAHLDLDEWDAALTPVAADATASSYVPTALKLKAQSLVWGGHVTHDLELTAAKVTDEWQLTARAQELEGDVYYQLAAADAMAANKGRLYARLKRLHITPSAAPQLEALLDAQPPSIPALDIVVDDFKVRSRSLGRMEVLAINHMATGTGGVAEWRLNKFNFDTPEATFRSSGNWTRIAAMAVTGEAAVSERRRTALNFKLDIKDSGALLARFGMNDVVRQGRGKLEGQLSWVGAPLKVNYPSLSGSLNVQVSSGQFLKADPGLAKLFGVLSLQALPRRLTLDFRDVFSEGFAFDFLRGDMKVENGMAYTNNLQMKGVNAAVLMQGQADIAHETQDLEVVVVPELNTGTASLIATVINPAVGLGSFLAQLFLQRPLVESNTKNFRITGKWDDPQVAEVHKSAAKPGQRAP